MTHKEYSNTDAIHADPRIHLIQTLLESILELVELERNGKPVMVDGFRLKNSRDWTIPLSISCLESLGSPSTYCNLNCVFCYELGNPPQMAYSPKRPFLTVNEAEARLLYYSQKEGRCMPPPIAVVREPFMNPQYLEILRRVRRRSPEEYFYLMTNGSFLTEDVVVELIPLQPIEIIVSLNTANPELRRRLMRDQHPEVAINGISLLRKYAIPFVGGLVAWPEFPIDDFEETIRFLDAHDALMVKIHLGGYTRYFSIKKGLDVEEYWKQTICLVKKLRKELSTPIVFSMELYVENESTPRVLGTLKNSPACKAGVRPGDIITRVGSHAVSTQFEARFYLDRLNSSLIELEVLRESNRIKLTIEPPTEFLFPFTRAVYDSSRFSGIVIAQGLNLLDLRRLEKIINDSNASRVLLLSSALLKPLCEELLYRFYDMGNLELFIEAPEHRFWGGNILVGDLYMVSDFVEHIKGFIKAKDFKPDLVVIPSTPFSPWGSDLTGVHYSEIERLTETKVELLRAERIM
jgi:wyosine [tRNA(Phe)-imidazoG37] synthetase (radical SAM superfamily)